jgi:hypothetical protein
MRLGFLGLLLLVPLTGCATRTLDITSEPSGALVFLNGTEVGRTPMRYDFLWYGDYDVILRRDGYETIKTHRKINAPLMFIPPIDLIGEAVGARDHRRWHFNMSVPSDTAADPEAMMDRGRSLKKELRSSQYTREPTTLPTRPPATQPIR